MNSFHFLFLFFLPPTWLALPTCVAWVVPYSYTTLYPELAIYNLYLFLLGKRTYLYPKRTLLYFQGTFGEYDPWRSEMYLRCDCISGNIRMTLSLTAFIADSEPTRFSCPGSSSALPRLTQLRCFTWSPHCFSAWPVSVPLLHRSLRIQCSGPPPMAPQRSGSCTRTRR